MLREKVFVLLKIRSFCAISKEKIDFFQNCLFFFVITSSRPEKIYEDFLFTSGIRLGLLSGFGYSWPHQLSSVLFLPPLFPYGETMHYIRLGVSLVFALVWLLSLVFMLPAFPYWALLLTAITLMTPWRGILFMCLYKAGIHQLKWRKRLAPLAKIWPAFGAFLKAEKPEETAPCTPSINILLLNLYTYNEDVSAQVDFLKQQQADVLALCEVNSKMHAAFNQFKGEYPYQYTIPITDTVLGYSMAILSKVPLKHVRSDANGRMVHYEVYHPNGTFHFVHLHPHAPFTPQRTDKRNAITDLVRNVKTPYPIVVGGDFNNVPWDVHVRRVCKAQGLKLASLPKATLPAEYHLFGIRLKLKPVAPFDFVLLTQSATVHEARAFRAPDTDHFGYQLRFSL